MTAEDDATGDDAAGDPATAAPAAELLIWSDVVHKQTDGCLLHFWRLSFVPDYDRAAIFRALDRLYDEFEIESHIAYETLGEFDLMLRLWVRRNITPADIEVRLYDLLKPASLWKADYIQCSTYAHWAQGGRVATDLDEAERVPQPEIAVSDDLISPINFYNEQQFAGNRIARPDGAEELVARGVLCPISLVTKGVRFYITFGHPMVPAGRDDLKDVLARIVEMFETLDARWKTDVEDYVPQLSVYFGQGSMTELLILARAPYGSFHPYIHEVVHGLRRVGLARHRMRPYTHVFADENFSEFSEKRSTASGHFTEDMVYGGETARLEFKASFVTDIRREWTTGVAEANDAMKDSVIKTVCGFLNSPQGGTLVIGVLEVERERSKQSSESQEKLLEWLSSTADYDRENALLPSGEYRNAILGIGREYGPGTKYRDADTYLGAIKDTLRTHIEPNPWPWTSLITQTVEGREIVVLFVRPANTWCYAKLFKEPEPQFFVREANSTRPYKGLEADLYRLAGLDGPLGRTRG
jgi:hypothetical protein